MKDARFCLYCGCVLNTTAGDVRICHGMEHPADQPREFPPPADRITVEALFAEIGRVFTLLVANLDHNHLCCDRRECPNIIPAEDEADALKYCMLAVAGDQEGGISSIRFQVLCLDCRQRLDLRGACELNVKAPAIDEILPDTPAEMPEGL